MKQKEFFAEDNQSIEDLYTDMPEYNNAKQPNAEITATFKFRNQEDYEKFHKLIKNHVYKTNKVFDGMQKKDKKQAWFPLKEKPSNFYYLANKDLQPQYPIYIVSKGRVERNPTRKALQEMKVDFYMVVEKSEYEQYAKYINKKNLLILPDKFKDDYDTFWHDDDTRTGAGAARNFAWQHSIDNGFDWHWVMDDNIESFEIFNQNKKIKCLSSSIFKVAEDFVLRFKNVGQAGFQYANFMPSTDYRPPIKINTRIYSCLFINNNLPFRWRGRYNEDTDLSLRILKSGLCTIQFNSFLQGKRATQTMSGGNSKEFYDEEGTHNKSKMLVEMHPDVCVLTKKWNRWHHHCNYNIFKTELIQKKMYKKNDIKFDLKRK